MNKKILFSLSIGIMIFCSCSDFEKINTNPTAANIDQVKIDYFINQSITDAQQDPHIAERIFCLNWMPASRYISGNTSSGISYGEYNIGWITDYYRYLSGWLTSANIAVNLADKKLEGNISDSEKKIIINLREVARIWRAYLTSEFVDNFGVMPIDGFKGDNPNFNTCKEVYYYMLKELSEAQNNLDLNVRVGEEYKVNDRVYKFDFIKWKRYANSLRMRFAMRLSEVDPQKAQEEFENAARNKCIDNNADNFAVKEMDGWNSLAGVMSRQWDNFNISATVNNLMIGLGGITTREQFSKVSSERQDKIYKSIKDDDYIGIRYSNHFATTTDDPSKGFWFDGLHNIIDPRAYALFSIPGDFEDGDYCMYPLWNSNSKKLNRAIKNKDENNQVTVIDSLKGAYTWNAPSLGNWGKKGSLNEMYDWPYALPGLKLRFRDSNNSRIFFGSWETYFLIAEAAERGWNVKMTAKDAYENGIKMNFEYLGISEYAKKYISSNEYNNVGTSVNWDHTTEPPATKKMKAIDGYTKKSITYVYEYPNANNTLYGKKLNDHLTKIITQKYLSNMPWLPLEAWNDQRRLGLPFFNTPMVEQGLVTVPTLNQNNYEHQNLKFYAQRLKFPSSLEANNPIGYKDAVKKLGGPDEIFTPIWWAKH